MRFRRTTAPKPAGTACALLALAATFSACRQPPSPPATADGSTVPISYAVFAWKDERDFVRISEYFTDRENTGANCIVRSDPETREGLYFLLALEPFEKIPAGSRATLRYFRPDKTEAQQQIFVIPETYMETPAGEIRLGLTGDAWPRALRGDRPTAWEISVESPEGELLVRRRSFLWALPKPKTPAPEDGNGNGPENEDEKK